MVSFTKLISQASDIVKQSGIEDRLQPIAFNFILEKLASEHSPRAPVKEEPLPERKESIPDARNRKERLATELGIKVEELDQIFVLHNERIEIVIRDLGTKKIEEQRQRLCHIYLTIKSYLFDAPQVPYQELKSTCENYGLRDPARQLSINIRSYPAIIPLGKKGSRDLAFMLNTQGKRDGVTLIKSLILKREI